MKKNWWLAVYGLVLVIVGFFSVMNLINTSHLNNCNDELTDLYQEENRLLFESEYLYNWMHYLHTLKVGELAEKDTKRAIKYRDDARNVWDDISNVSQEKDDKYREIREKQKECNIYRDSSNKWLSLSFWGYLILIFISLIVYEKTKK